MAAVHDLAIGRAQSDKYGCIIYSHNISADSHYGVDLTGRDERYRGSLLGLAAGNALGEAIEGSLDRSSDSSAALGILLRFLQRHLLPSSTNLCILYSCLVIMRRNLKYHALPAYDG